MSALGFAVYCIEQGGAGISWRSDPEAPADTYLFVEFRGQRANGPGDVRIKRMSGRWSRWFKCPNIINVSRLLGADVKWRDVDADVKAWLAGLTSNEDLVRSIEQRQQG